MRTRRWTPSQKSSRSVTEFLLLLLAVLWVSSMEEEGWRGGFVSQSAGRRELASFNPRPSAVRLDALVGSGFSVGWQCCQVRRLVFLWAVGWAISALLKGQMGLAKGGEVAFLGPHPFPPFPSLSSQPTRTCHDRSSTLLASDERLCSLSHNVSVVERRRLLTILSSPIPSSS